MARTGDYPCYVISIAAQLLGMHVQTLRYYERAGLVQPSRSNGNIRLYSQQDLERVREVRGLMEDLGVNLAGAEVILRMREHLRQLERECDMLRAKAEQLETDMELVRQQLEPLAKAVERYRRMRTGKRVGNLPFGGYPDG
ncbi:MAG: MerR family transcriptional regulator [Dehalococcoidia bacterium]|nr:MerR family transcriptional regulator [Dehalococcoidia bacterium]